MKIKEDNGKAANRIYIILGIIIFIQLATIIYGFQFKKEGYHSDEMWSYGYANSYYLKDIYMNELGQPINYNEWVKGRVLRDYIVVNEGEEFAYDSIYHNQMYDLSPPLHSMVLHTICSFFPEQYSKWYSFSINIVAFIVSVIFLFKAARILKGDCFALCCCIVYGISWGARDTYLYLRMYAMCTALAMIIVYNLVAWFKRLEKEKKVINKHLVGMCLTSFVAFLTHYYMIALVGLLTFFTCVVLLFKKKIKTMLLYGFCMLGTLIASILIFPTLLHIARGQSTKVAAEAAQTMNYNFEIRFRIILNMITNKVFSIPVSIYRSGMFPIVIAYVVVILIWIIPLVFLLRKTKFIKFLKKRILFFFKHSPKIVRYLWRRINWLYLVLLATIVSQIIVVGETSNVYGMGKYIDRYILYLYPIAVLIGLGFSFWIGKILFKKKKNVQYVMVGITVLLVGVNIYNRIEHSEYYFVADDKNSIFVNYDEVSIADVVKDKKCIYLARELWLLTALVPDLMVTDEFYQTHIAQYKNCEEAYRSRAKEGQVVLLVDASFVESSLDRWVDENENIEMIEEDANIDSSKRLYDEILQYFEDLEPDTKMKKLTTRYIMTRPMEVYLINP